MKKVEIRSMSNNKYQEELSNIQNAIAESIEEASSEEILAELIEAGEDPKIVAEQVRQVLLRAVNDYKLIRLQQLREQHDQEVAEIERTRALRVLPSIAEMREKLVSLLSINSFLGPQELTFQGREFGGDLNKLSDEDIKSFYTSLQTLGFVDEAEPREEEK
jgi:hypothetical protein